MSNPKVLVGCPTSKHKEYCLSEYVKGVKRLDYENYDILLVDNSLGDSYADKIKKQKIKVIKDTYFQDVRQRIVHSRNILRELVFKGDYDYFLSLEQDVIPPPDIIQRLLAHKKEVVAGLYFVNKEKNTNGVITVEPRPLVYVEVPDMDPDKMYYLNKDFAQNSNQLIEAYATGLGCILISKEVLSKIPFRYEPEVDCYDDVFFAKDLKEKGIKLFVDLSIKCEHLH